MKFVCLGYIDENRWNAIPAERRDAMIEECFDYDDVLHKNGHIVGGHGLQDARTARTLDYRDGKVVVTDGPFAESKEQIGGILVIEAQDMDEAVRLMSKHPGVRLGGPFEIRAVDTDIEQRWRERNR